MVEGIEDGIKKKGTEKETEKPRPVPGRDINLENWKKFVIAKMRKVEGNHKVFHEIWMVNKNTGVWVSWDEKD